MIFLASIDFEFRRRFLDRTERFHHQNGMMRDDCAPAFAHDRRMRYAFGIADIHDVPDNVVHVFLERVIGGAVEIAARTVVIDPESAADVQISELVSELRQLGVITRRFAHRALDRGNVGNLRADVKMDELETMRKTSLLQHFARRHQARSVQTELRVFAAARRPASRAFAVKPHTNSNERLDANFLSRANRLLELLQFFHHDDDGLVELATEQRDANERAILVAVADDEALRILVHRERGDQFRFAARFETEMKLLACVDNFFDHFAQLIDLDRENAAILIFVIEFRHRVLKRAIDRFDAVSQQILETNHERETEAALPRFADHLHDVDAPAVVLKWTRNDIARFVNGEVIAAPTIDIVSRDRGFDIPLAFHFLRERHVQSAPSFRAVNMQAFGQNFYANVARRRLLVFRRRSHTVSLHG